MAGQRIDDHSFWAGSKPKGSVYPEKAKMKAIDDAHEGGSLSKYEDTEEAIRSTQNMGVKKAKSHDQKTGYRN